jgi:uncharacterized protein YndB with AHSA1/START domain
MSAVEDHVSVVELTAPVDAVHDALATAKGLRGWWSTDVAREPDGHLRLRWSASDFLLIRVDRAEPPYELDWSFVDQRDGNLPQADEWVGTRASFRLEETPHGTRLTLTHCGLTPLDCASICTGGWDRFLGSSLKRLVETGRGLPWSAGAR